MTVYLVGAGPGDPGLLTVRAAQLLARADVVVHDRLIDPQLLRLAPNSALLIDVGKRAGLESSSQDRINALLVEHGKRAECVVRLKGGDPYVFGRGGEEAMALRDAGCAYEVVPGVSAVASVAAAAGVPITMRGVASGFVVITGHDLSAEGATTRQTWRAIAQSNLTIIVFMGSANRSAIAASLVAEGRSPDTAVLVVQEGTTSRQRSTRTTLANVASLPMESPVTLVIGEVAKMSLFSYEDRPLSSWSVVVTRDEHSQALLSDQLELAGAQVISVPTIAVADPEDERASLRHTLSSIDSFDWVVFTSANGVDRVFEEVRDTRFFATTKVAAIGSATERRLSERGIRADFVPDRFVSEAFVEQFLAYQTVEKGVLVVRAQEGRDVIETGLAERGHFVEVAFAYRVTHPHLAPEALAEISKADAIVFTSPSTIRGLLSANEAVSLPAVIATIGPITSETAGEVGLTVSVEATVHSVEGLVGALVHFAAKRSAN